MTPRLHRNLLRLRARLAFAAGVAIGLVCAAPAQAQLGAPRIALPAWPALPSPTVPAVPELPRVPPPLAPQALPGLASVQGLRLATVRELLRDHPDVLEADPAGEPVRRAELLLVAPAPATLAAALAAGFVVLREQVLPELELRQLVLRAPPGLALADALARLRALDPQLDADFNHVYTRSGELTVAGAAGPGTAPASARRVGLVDSGLDRQHAALRSAEVRHWGCADRPVPSPHGTAVASLLVGRDEAFAGTAPGARLYAADIYCGEPGGGAAETIAAALAWLAREQVAVVNLSLVGPANRVLERAVQALQRKGHLLVAAVGNDGPAAPPLFPASYPGVVGVTAVAPSRRVLPEAAQGAQVLLAAPGADLAVAQAGGGYVVARGTSFAAPLVAGLLAEVLREPDRAAAAAALVQVVAGAHDLGAPGRDPVYGLGLVGERARIVPERVQARSR